MKNEIDELTEAFVKLAVKMGDQFLTYRMARKGMTEERRCRWRRLDSTTLSDLCTVSLQIPVDVKDLEELAAQEVMDGVHISDISEEMASAGGALIRLSQGGGAAGEGDRGRAGAGNWSWNRT